MRFRDEELASKLQAAFKSGDEEEQKSAWAAFTESVREGIMADFEELGPNADANTLAARGYRQLTMKEKKWYDKVIGCFKAPDIKMAFTTLIGSDTEDDQMPETIIEDVYRDLVRDRPLLQKLGLRYVGYATKWILNDHSVQKAVWGAITDEITKQITSGFKVIDITQNKLTAYACIERGMLDIGPVYLDAYIRSCLYEALAEGMEYGFVKGAGAKKHEPIGLIKDLEGAEDQTTGYPDKAKISVTDFTPKNYCALVARMAKTQSGAPRSFGEVCLLCNQSDYLTKIVPATTILNTAGQYVRDLFPFPTEVIVCNQLADGDAVLFLPNEYFAAAGGAGNGVIDSSNDYKFLEDMTYWKLRQYATGRCTDNTCALYLDISAIEEAYAIVKTKAVS